MGSKYKRRAFSKVRFPIGAKLTLIISLILIISLGSITVFTAWFGHTHLRVTAQENNFETNRRSVIEAETLLTNIQSNSRVLIQTINVLMFRAAAVKETADFFWSENPQITAVFFVIPGRQEQLLINKRFLSFQKIDEGMVSAFIDGNKAALGRAVRGETVLQNAAPHFSRAILGLFYPWQGGGVAVVLFSSEGLNISFGYGVNNSYMLNADGDIISHVDFSVIKEKTNVKNLDFVRAIFDSPEHDKQQIIESDFGAVRSSSGNVIFGVFEPVWKKIKPTVKLVVDKSAEILKKYGILKIINKQKKPRQFMAYTKLNTAGAVVITSVDYNKIFESFTIAIMCNIYIAIVALIISIVFIWFFSKTISIPLRALAAAANQIEGGKFDQKLHSKAGDEIGVLTNSFKKMCSALNVFGKFTNKEIAVKTMRGDIKPDGLSRYGTIFFSGISNFTSKLDNFNRFFGAEASDKIVCWLNKYFTQMVDCVEKTNGCADKFIGDVLMAHWGITHSAGSPRKDAFNCVKAALMMRKILYFMNRERKSGDLSNPSIRIGCGISSGIVAAGQLGTEKRMEYTVIGNPVNVASHIETLTKTFGADILISEDTWKLVGDKFITEELPPMPVNGKTTPLRVFAVINFTGDVKGPQSLEEVRSLLGIEAPEIDKI